MPSEFVIGGGIAVEDVNEKGRACVGVCAGKGEGGGPDGVEIVFDGFGTTNALGGTTVDYGMPNEEGVGEGEKVFIGEVLRREAQFNLVGRHGGGKGCGSSCEVRQLWERRYNEVC